MLLFQRTIRLFYTVRYLKTGQVINRILRHFQRINIASDGQPSLSLPVMEMIEPARRSARMQAATQVSFLNRTGDISSADIWNSQAFSKLWLYNLHYFDDLNAGTSSQRRLWHRSLIERWISENPVGHGNGWEAYPLSLRIINWIKWALSGNELSEAAVVSLALQCRYLQQTLETHLLGNHLFTNAKALLLAGLFFKGDEARSWYEAGVKIVKEQLPEQVLADGGNFELSTMYHALFVEDLLDIVNLHWVYQKKSPVPAEQYIPGMLNWLRGMCHPDGEIAFFNDAAMDVAPAPNQLLSYAERLGYELSAALEMPLQDFPVSGYSRIVLGPLVALVDRAAIGPDYLPGHGHADTLSFEMSLYGQRVIVNSGTSVYGDGPQRQLERSTRSHATLEIDGENSSEVWAGFRVARRARIHDRVNSVHDDCVILAATHDGYKRLRGKPLHRREWRFSENQVVVTDQVVGSGEHRIAIVLPLHPAVVVNSHTVKNISLSIENHTLQITFRGNGQLRLEGGCYYPRFGVELPNTRLVYEMVTNLPVQAETDISFSEDRP